MDLRPSSLEGLLVHHYVVALRTLCYRSENHGFASSRTGRDCPHRCGIISGLWEQARRCKQCADSAASLAHGIPDAQTRHPVQRHRVTLGTLCWAYFFCPPSLSSTTSAQPEHTRLGRIMPLSFSKGLGWSEFTPLAILQHSWIRSGDAVHDFL